MIDVRCDRCDHELDKPGALLFSPPIPPHDTVVKRHLCWGCYERVLGVLDETAS